MVLTAKSQITAVKSTKLAPSSSSTSDRMHAAASSFKRGHIYANNTQAYLNMAAHIKADILNIWL